MDDRTPEATEFVYVPQASWLPAIAAFGIAGVLTGIFVWWPYGVVGAVLAVVALAGMLRGTASDIGRLPRRQKLTTAVVPPVPPRKRAG